MGKGDRATVRWKNDRVKKKKSRDKRHAVDRGQRDNAAPPSAAESDSPESAPGGPPGAR